MLTNETKIFISDLHLGDGSRTDDFHKTGQFLKFLDTIKAEKAARLIIAGDLLELWQADLDRIVFFHSRVIRQLLVLAKEDRLVYLIGNHDHLPFVKYLQPELNIQLEFEDRGYGIWSEHGNQYDIFNRYKDPRMAVRNRFGRGVAYLTGWLERIFHPDIDEWADKLLMEREGSFLKDAAPIKNKLTPSSRLYYKKGGDLSEYEEAARKLIDKGNRVVIFGHTHRPALKRLGNGIYANCGCWSGKGVPTYVRVCNTKVELRDGIDHHILNSLEL